MYTVPTFKIRGIISAISTKTTESRTKDLFCPMLPDIRQSIFFWKVLRLRPLVLLVTFHSFCSLSYDRSVASSKASSPQIAI
jgi:hypothetical protein